MAHTYHDISGNNNHFELMNYTTGNFSKQDQFHYLQRGFNYGRLGVNRLPYSDKMEDYWLSSNNYIELLETGLPDPLGGNRAIRIKYNTNSSPGSVISVLTESLTRPYPNLSTPRGNYTISAYVKNAVPDEINLFRLAIRLSTRSEDFIASNNWERYSFYGNHNVDRYVKNGIINSSQDTSLDIIVFGIQMELENNLSNYEPTMFIGKSDGYKPKVENSDIDAEMNETIIFKQDSKSFLNTGALLEPYDYPALKQADKNEHFWYIGQDQGETIPRKVNHYELALENLMSDKLFIDKTDK